MHTREVVTFFFHFKAQRPIRGQLMSLALSKQQLVVCTKKHKFVFVFYAERVIVFFTRDKDEDKEVNRAFYNYRSHLGNIFSAYLVVYELETLLNLPSVQLQ